MLFAIILISGCEKEEKANIDICLNTFGNDVIVVADYQIKDFCKRSIVYRSADDKNYEVVGEIEIADMKNKQGVFIDTSIDFEGDYFYKVSYGGHLSNSNTIKFTKGNNPIRIYPNPFSDTLTIEFNAFCMPYDVRFFDILGRNVFSENQITTATKQLYLNALPNGIYIVRFYLGAKAFTYKIVKQ